MEKNTQLQAKATGSRHFGDEFYSVKTVENLYNEMKAKKEPKDPQKKAAYQRVMATMAPRQFCEVKARLEFQKDQVVWARAMANNPFALGWKSDDGVVMATFLMEVAQEGLDQLVEDLQEASENAKKFWPGRGVEPHVLIESLKLATEYDGERNGPLCSKD